MVLRAGGLIHTNLAQRARLGAATSARAESPYHLGFETASTGRTYCSLSNFSSSSSNCEKMSIVSWIGRGVLMSTPAFFRISMG